MVFDSDQLLFSHFLISGTAIHEGSFADLCMKYHIEIQPQRVILLSVDRYPDLAISKDLEWNISIGQSLLTAVKSLTTVPFISVWVGEGLLALLIDCRTIEKGHVDYLQNMVKGIQKEFHKSGLTISAGIGPFYDDPYLMYKSFKEAKKALRNRFFEGNNLIYVYEAKQESKSVSSSKIIREKKIRLFSTIKIGDVEKSVEYLSELLEIFSDVYHRDVNLFKSEVFEIVQELSRMLIDIGQNASEILVENSKMIQELLFIGRYDKFVQTLVQYWQKITINIASEDHYGNSTFLTTAILYIKANHHKKITLSEISNHCFVSPQYFAHLFKKETGQSFGEFLCELRMKKAKYLLEYTQLSIKEIAIYAGFLDANYFTRKFKSTFGITPTKWKSEIVFEK
jgi:two-component system, response regulator YesN